ncbi:MAG: tryptophan--tRNA ligase [Gammaproteobacteria bacterium]|nr:tryptophan--tRNA ligase [Gammaproteobacteria bacterium]|tara:strand:+ start:1805 stop:2824 length:1020 start_codon:yes stop_codon:yes gene_type:complete
MNLQNKKRVLTGITTSGTPHLGNLAGAILPAIRASEDASVSSFLFLADYHSLIKNLDPELTHSSSLEIAACWLACGLDPEKVTFYRQSDISHILELTWILSCLTGKGLMNRAHAYKDAISKNKNSKLVDTDKGISMGLYNYPILMAADILMFNADIVPVGQDQKQHLEMTRDIASKFNNHYGQIFTIPDISTAEDAGVLPGTDGRKMSKSYKNVVPIFLDTNELRQKIMKIKTDSKEPGEPKEPKNSSIFSIYRAFASIDETKKFRDNYHEGIGWGAAKELLFELLEDQIQPLRKNYKELVKDKENLEQILLLGAEKALDISTPVIKKVRKAVGIRSFG